jgi:hypothetical protein
VQGCVLRCLVLVQWRVGCRLKIAASRVAARWADAVTDHWQSWRRWACRLLTGLPGLRSTVFSAWLAYCGSEQQALLLPVFAAATVLSS